VYRRRCVGGCGGVQTGPLQLVLPIGKSAPKEGESEQVIRSADTYSTCIMMYVLCVNHPIHVRWIMEDGMRDGSPSITTRFTG
jgi:hypothetical protein